jgi:hypothetical protein
MVRISRSHVLVGAICTLLATTTASAQTGAPAAGLGQSWPNTTDVSASPHYHVYVFYRDGSRYFQVNDLNGNVLGAFATAGHQFMILPMGETSGVVHVLSSIATSANSNSSTETIYSDKSITITANPAVSGGVAQPQTCDALNCTIINAVSAPTSPVVSGGGTHSQTCNALDCTIINAVPVASDSQPQQCNPLDCTIINAVPETRAINAAAAVPAASDSQPQKCNPLDCTIINVAPTNTN